METQSGQYLKKKTRATYINELTTNHMTGSVLFVLIDRLLDRKCETKMFFRTILK